jgi:hypothetical protein
METVAIPEEVPIVEALEKETPVKTTFPEVEAESVGDEIVRVSMNEKHFCWLPEEFELEDTPWRVCNVSSDEYGPAVMFKRES